jgi:anti-sigma regulatory factor (Ser/Thr protein kinase)
MIAYTRAPRPWRVSAGVSRALDRQTTRSFPARLDLLPRVAAYLEETCAAAGLVRDDCLRLTLLVEELFTNTVQHGHGGDTDALVSLSVEVGAGEISLVYEDSAPSRDPFATPPRLDESASVEERPVGGLGLSLIAGIVERLEYSHVAGRNRLHLVVRRPDAAGAGPAPADP